ncbi:hypothetical protein O6H91_03G097100 [Diphasiastrum complanatum]|uniref:Uncharacterized protein n=1 Tax=Diphasiastrum complanatum TaxID=34168 RepID=A0ACC2E9F0_DIPCM|nr:hypothetical protein O6H91_03G097100 [Diphasiastrum complanatum]
MSSSLRKHFFIKRKEVNYKLVKSVMNPFTFSISALYQLSPISRSVGCVSLAAHGSLLTYVLNHCSLPLSPISALYHLSPISRSAGCVSVAAHPYALNDCSLPLLL